MLSPRTRSAYSVVASRIVTSTPARASAPPSDAPPMPPPTITTSVPPIPPPLDRVDPGGVPTQERRHEDPEGQDAPVRQRQAEVAEEQHQQPGGRERGDQTDDECGQQDTDHL